MNWRRTGLPCTALIAAAFTLASGTGCRPAGSTVLGTPPTGLTTSVAAMLAADLPAVTNTAVMLEGVIVEKCPVAGCWFKLRDGTSVLKVDTKYAGFVVLDVPLTTPVTVAGHLAGEGSERVLVATGMRY